MTPVFYPISALGAHTRGVIKLNPLTSYLDIFRTVFGGNASATLKEWLMMIGSSILVFIFSFNFFLKRWPKVMVKL